MTFRQRRVADCIVPNIPEGSERLAGGKRSATTGTRFAPRDYPGGITARVLLETFAIILSPAMVVSS